MLEIFSKLKWAALVPMANESEDFQPFVTELRRTLDRMGSGHVFFVVDQSSKDNTRDLCDALAGEDDRFTTLWAPECRNVVDAYMRGYQAAFDAGFAYVIEMDAGLSHDPRAIPMFLRSLNEGNECAFGSRFINGGSMVDSPWSRRWLSRGGTILSKVFLGCRLHDATSGYQGFHRDIVGLLLSKKLKSKAHFYQTEVRYLLRKRRYIEVPIHYRAPSPRVSQGAICDSIKVLAYYVLRRWKGNADSL